MLPATSQSRPALRRRWPVSAATVDLPLVPVTVSTRLFCRTCQAKSSMSPTTGMSSCNAFCTKGSASGSPGLRHSRSMLCSSAALNGPVCSSPAKSSLRGGDTRVSPPRRDDFAGELHTGPFSAALLQSIDLLCLSPGLPLADPLVQKALQLDIPVVGDIELFAWHVRQKSRVLTVTGTNGKSTVAALTGHLLRKAGLDCEVAGNIGPAVLDASLRRSGPPAAWVLELSSYQLETTWSLDPDAAAMLNLTEDHLDRYSGLAEYGAAKARIFIGSGIQVLNRGDRRSLAMAQSGRAQITFGLDAPATGGDFGVTAGVMVQGRTPLLRVDELPIRGWPNVANAVAACALARTLGVSHQALA